MRTLLFVPATNDRMLERAAESAADALVVDLEDAVPAARKAAARKNARAWIDGLARRTKPVFVRVNAIDSGLTRDDLLAVVAKGLAGVVLPKAADPQDIRDLDVLLREAEVGAGVRPGDVRTIPLIESPRAVLRCEQIATASDRVLALSVGGEDYTRETGGVRDRSGASLQYIRGVVVNVAAAYGLLAIDTPYADYRDEAGLRAETQLARAMGLTGKYVIHPDQIAPVNAAFTPTTGELEQARAMVDAYERALAAGTGAVQVDGRMVDAPVAERARALLRSAGGRPKTSRLP